MVKAISLFAAFVATMWGAFGAVGYSPVYTVSYGTICLWAALISGTFLWLYIEQKQKLAMGMFLSWGGTASVMGWWWVYSLLDRPEWMLNNPLLFAGVGLYAIGAVIHFQSIGAALKVSNWFFEWTLGAGFILSLVLYLSFI